MKKGLVILANYHPNPSSVANCMKPLIRNLSKICDIDILTDRTHVYIPQFEIVDNINIYRIDDLRKMNTFGLDDLVKIESSYPLRLITKGISFILKGLYYLKYVIIAKEKNTAGWEVKRVFEKFEELHKKQKYDFVISVSLPFQSHYIAEVIKDKYKDSIKWAVFEFDPFAYNFVIKANKKLRKEMKRDEERIFKKADCIVLTPELYEFYTREKYIESSSKVKKLPFANIEPIRYEFNNVSNNFMEKNKVNCFFSGRLYNDIRNPSTVIELFSETCENVHLIMMTNFSIEKLQEFTSEEYKPTVIPFQNRDTALYNLVHADILVNIGNTVEHQVPGKIFEYMSTGKPIIHFSKIKNDPAVKYLLKYPKVLIINEWEKEKHNYKKMIEEFCEQNKNYELLFDEVSEYLGEYSGSVVQDKFIQILNEMLGEQLINE